MSLLKVYITEPVCISCVIDLPFNPSILKGLTQFIISCQEIQSPMQKSECSLCHFIFPWSLLHSTTKGKSRDTVTCHFYYFPTCLWDCVSKIVDYSFDTIHGCGFLLYKDICSKVDKRPFSYFVAKSDYLRLNLDYFSTF